MNKLYAHWRTGSARATVFVLFVLLALSLNMQAQAPIKSVVKPEIQDSLLLSDSVKVQKAPAPLVPLFVPMLDHGSIVERGSEPTIRVHRYDIQRTFYTSFDELLESRLPAFSLHQGYYALPNTFRVLGAGARDNAILFNGRPLNDLSTAILPPNFYPTEFMQQAQILLGSEAVVVADNSSGMVMNLQEPRYNAKTPYTRLWYSEGANGYISSDGTLSQNIAANVNMTLGFRREAGDGRYQNQAIDSWNLRALFRWNLSEHTNISIVELFTNRAMGLNGGVDTSGTIDVNDELSAQVRFPLFNQRVISHDLSTTLSTLLREDSSARFQLCAYYSHSTWHLGRDSSLIFRNDSALGLNWANVRAGISGRLEQRFVDRMHMIVGADAELQSADSNDYYRAVSRGRLAAFGQVRFDLSDGMQLSGGARLQQLASTTSISLGAKLHIQLSSAFRLVADISQSSRVPSVSEGVDLDQEHNTLLFADLQYRDSSVRASVLAFSREVVNPIIAQATSSASGQQIVTSSFSSRDTRVVSGAELRAGWNAGPWIFSSRIQAHLSQLDGASEQLLPAVQGSASAEYNYTIGKNLLSLGISARARSSFFGESFIPMNWSYIPASVEQVAAFGGIDVFGGAKIGDAFIKIQYQNILSNSYSSLSTFPSVVRNFSLSIAWTFFD